MLTITLPWWTVPLAVFAAFSGFGWVRFSIEAGRGRRDTDGEPQLFVLCVLGLIVSLVVALVMKP